MSTTPTPPPAQPAAQLPVVPYGPTGTQTGGAASGATVDLSKKSVAATAGKWAIRILLPLLVRALFRAIFRH